MTLANKTIGNAISGGLGYVWPIMLAITTTPYIVYKLGNDAYGILALVTSVLGFFAFLDLGVTNAAVKFVSEAYAKDDIDEISKIISSSLSVFIMAGVLGGVLIALITNTLVQRVLKIPASYVSDSTFAFYVASCGLVLNMVVGVFASVPKAIQRYDLATKVNIIVGTSLTLSMVLTVYLGYGLKQIIIINFLSSLISLILYISITKKYLKGVSIRMRFNPSTFKKLFQFGKYSLVVVFSATFYYQVDKLLIGSFLGAASVAFYVVPASIAAGIFSIIVSLMVVVFPLCSHLYATGEYDKLRELYLKASKYGFIVVVSIATPVIVLSTQIMSHWMGADYGPRSGAVLAILTISVIFNSLGIIPFFILDGVGMPGVNAKVSILSAVTNVCLCLLLIPRIGLWGAALANLANFLFVVLNLAAVDTKVLRIGMKRLAGDAWLRPLTMGLLQAMTTYYVLMPFVKGRLSLLLVILVSIGIYYSASLLFKVINTEDKYLFKQYVNFRLKMD